MKITLSLAGDPVTCPRPRAKVHEKGVKMDADYMKWKAAAAMILMNQARRAGWPVGKRVLCRIEVRFIFARPQKWRKDMEGCTEETWAEGARVKRWAAPDADNMLKAVMDACQLGRLVSNDCDIEIGSVTRWYAAAGDGAGIEITLDTEV